MAEDDERVEAEKLELILRRATEIDHQRKGDQTALTVSELERVADEIGLSRESLRQALVEVRSGALATRGGGSVVDRYFGSAVSVVERVVPGTVAQIKALLRMFMDRQLFEVTRDRGDRLEWRPAQGMVSGLQRTLDFSGRYRLDHIEHVETALTPAGDDEVRVTFTLGFGKYRSENVTGAGIGSVAVTAGSSIPLALTVGLTAGALAIVGGLALSAVIIGATRGAYRKQVETSAEAVELFLDTLEQR